MCGARNDIAESLQQIGLSAADVEAFSIPDAVLRDLAEVMPLLPEGRVHPEIEVDEDDGSTVLRWFSPCMKHSLSFTFIGKGTVTGYVSTSPLESAWKVPVGDADFIRLQLSRDIAIMILCGTKSRSLSPG